MSDASWAVQSAVYAQLRADARVQATIGDPARIFDAPPETAVFPYLTIGETRVSDYPGLAGGFEHDLRLYAYSQYAGRREVKRIMSAVYDAIHETAFDVPGFRLVNMRYVFADVLRRREPDTYQGVMRYRAVTEPLVAA
ncbi:MAG: DUF3168 domain-containing protein [Pseudomonadota bacterium]